MSWTNNYTGEETARALITSNMVSHHEGSLRIRIGEADLTITGRVYKVDLSRLMRQRCMVPGAISSFRIVSTNSHTVYRSE